MYFNTLDVITSTLEPTEITRTTATLNGTISFGDAPITEQGFIFKKQYENEKTILVSNNNSTLTYEIMGGQSKLYSKKNNKNGI
ncbi:MAG: hypothetical protein LBC89_07025 [Bacteroidales bacterium]|jgi:hypothetical protein|nr:hypothetical protein [Bacteroidales bacterium]